MFYYFGYGSNLSVVSLRAKGVAPLRSEPATLEGWQLTFNVLDFFRIEGGTGNIEPKAGDSVHGVLHACRDRDLSRLDELEALGIAYRRLEAPVITYSGRRVQAYVYIGLRPSPEPSAPSERYRNILVRGATDMRLDPAYIARLQAIPTCPAPNTAPVELPEAPTTRFTLSSLREHEFHTAFAGAVFDMRDARPEHEYLKRLLSGKDATLLFLKRMDSSDGTETFEQVAAGDFDPAQRRYLNGYLREFAREYRFAGRIDYGDRTSADAPEHPRQNRAPPPTMPRRTSWRHTFVAGTEDLPRVYAPASKVLLEAERTNQELGHENLGFLSESVGFMPLEHPKERLPAPFSPWDELMGRLPELYRSLRLRREVRELPVLRADEDHLEDEDLLRAGALLSMLAHAYYYTETRPPEEGLPPQITAPWKEVRRRLDREPAVLTYIDLIVYNWRLLDPERADPMRVDNMRLLFPTVDNDEERIFYLTQTEILAHCAPIVGACARAQEASLNDDPESLECELVTIIGCLQRAVRESLLNINPNPISSSHVDPVIWARTVAPFAVPMEEGVQGPSGTSSPIFNTLDIFFGRKGFETFLGKEIRGLRSTYPRHWRAFLEALSRVSISEYLEKTENKTLTGLYQEAVETYAGTNGFLGRHRMKVYGYLEIAFKVGRNVTIGGFKGFFEDRTWDQVDAELEHARLERMESFPSTCYTAYVRSVSPLEESDGVKHVVLDVSGSGLRYEAGDRCGVLPENGDDLVERTLDAFHAEGTEPVLLTEEWQQAVRLRPELRAAGTGDLVQLTLPMERILRWGRIRPVVPRTAEALHAITQNELLKEQIFKQATEKWELWDLIRFLESEGFDPRSLWNGEEPSSHLCRVIPPETFRMYSISSVMSSARTGSPVEIHLTVGRIRYSSERSDQPSETERLGTASNFLAAAADRKEPVSIIIQHPPRFALPRDPKAPIVMFAAGTGFSPFRAFLIERLRQLNAGPSWLFLALRSREYFDHYRAELAPLIASKKLRLRVAFSRDDVDVDAVEDEEGVRFVYRPGRRKRLEELLQKPEIARELWDLLRSEDEGGAGAYVYLCGRTRFARSIQDTLQVVFRGFQTGTPAEREQLALSVLHRLAGEDRYMQEIFTDARAADVSPVEHDVSEIVAHNDDEHGYWLVIDGIVYDLTEFVRMHPGGPRVIQGYAGMDASQGYGRAHSGRTETDAMRDMYRIGVVRRLDFGQSTKGLSDAERSRAAALTAAHRTWVKLVYLIVEMQNALENDQSLQRCVTIRGEAREEVTFYKLQRAIETHYRFVHLYAEGLGREPLRALWNTNRRLFAPESPASWMSNRLEEIFSGQDFAYATGLKDKLEELLREQRDRGVIEPSLTKSCELLSRLDRELLRQLKETARRGLRAFEIHGRAVVAEDGALVRETMMAFSELLADYLAQLKSEFAIKEGWMISIDLPEPRADSNRSLIPMTVLNTTLWTMEEDAERRVVILRRTATPVDHLDDLVRQNNRVIDLMKRYDADYGIVVDMRQATARNDPDFERAMGRLRNETQRFSRLAVLLDSEVGVLQVNRLGRDEQHRTFATQCESAAIQFAMGRA